MRRYDQNVEDAGEKLALYDGESEDVRCNRGGVLKDDVKIVGCD